MSRFSRLAPSSDVQLELLRDLTSRLLNASDIDDVLRVIAECTTTALGYEDCVIYLRANNDQLVQRVAYGPKSPNGTHVVAPISLPIGTGIVGAAAAAGQSILVKDTRRDPRYVVDDAERRSELSVPMMNEGVVIGVIDSEHSEPNFYTEADRKIITDIAAIAAARLRTAMATERLNQSISDLKTTRAELETLSNTDELTGLANRRRFEQVLFDTIEAGKQFSIGIMDMDKFKQVNDSHGHHEGDRVLRRFADILAEYVTADGLIAARLGGDEFAIFQAGPDLSSFDRMIEDIGAVVRSARWSANAALLDVTMSAGVATGFGDHVWTHADEALLLAKAEGGDQVVRFVSSDPRTIALRADRQWAQSIRDAISNDRFSLVAQPLVPARDSGDSGELVEVLLRYTAPDGSVLAPGAFIESAIRFGLIRQIDAWVLRHAITWLASQPTRVSIAVNVSTESMLSGLALRSAAAELRAHKIDADRLVIEVTEHAAIEDAHRFAEVLADARALGIRVAMDDFGSGWTSMALIQHNPVDIIKIDGNWVRQAATDPVAHTVVKAIIECGRLIGCTVVAEWIEDAVTRDLMASMGVHYLQGFFLGKPVPLGEYTRSST